MTGKWLVNNVGDYHNILLSVILGCKRIGGIRFVWRIHVPDPRKNMTEMELIEWLSSVTTTAPSAPPENDEK